MLTAESVIKLYFTDSVTGEARMALPKLYRLANSGKIPARKIEGRWFFYKDALDRWSKCEEFFQGVVSAKHKPFERIQE